jgi:segregation and condensation protein B
MSELKNQVESLLFSAGKRLTLEELGRLCREENLDAIRAAVEILKKELDDKQSSLMLVQEGEAYKLTVREKYISMVKKVVTTPELPKSIMETLAVVAYKAPVMQSHVIKIRTNKAYRHLEELEEMGYLTREKKGRSRLIKLTPKFFDYFDVPPDKLKEKFHNVAALEKAIEEKETAIAQTQQAIFVAAHDNTPKVEVFTDELPKLAPEIEIIGGKVGELQTYGEAPKPKKKHKHKHKAEEEAPKTPEEAAEALAQKILSEAGIETPEATEEETAEMEEEGKLTVEKIKREAAKEKPRKTEYTSKGMFPSGVPPELQEKIEHRVAEITGGETPEEASDENAEMGLPDIIPAPKPMTEEEETASEAEEEVKSEEENPPETPEEEEAVKEVESEAENPEDETPAEEAAEEKEASEEPAEKESQEEVAEEETAEEHEAPAPETKAKKHKHH